jgi:protoporphyrinogen/coproporphyrinogen III oxidase
MTEAKHIAVIGGGLAGITAALRLQQAGHTVDVFEAASQLGGVICSSTDQGYLREHAANAFLGGPPHGALALCHELGVAVEKSSPSAKKRSIFVDGKLQTLPRNPLEFARSRLLTTRGKQDLLREPLVPGRNIDNDGDQSVYEFAVRRFGPEAARTIIAPFVTGVYAADAREISLQAGFPRLADLDKHGGVIEGLLRKAGGGMYQRLAGLIGLRADETVANNTERGMWAPVGGLGSLINGIAAKLHTGGNGIKRIHLASPVSSLNTADNKVLLHVAGAQLRFDGAVVAVDAQHAAVLTAAVPELSSKLSDFSRTPVAMAYLGYPVSALTPSCQDGFGFLVAMGERLRVLGVVFESIVWPNRAPTGHALFRCIFGGGRDTSAYDLSDQDLVATAERDLTSALGIRANPSYQSVIRWQRGIPRIPVGHLSRVSNVTSIARRHRIALAGADFRAVAVNDICADASTIVEEVNAWG